MNYILSNDLFNFFCEEPTNCLIFSIFGIGYSLGTGVIVAVFHISGTWPFLIAVLISLYSCVMISHDFNESTKISNWKTCPELVLFDLHRKDVLYFPQWGVLS